MKKILLSLVLGLTLLSQTASAQTIAKGASLVVEPSGKTCTTAADGKQTCFASYTVDDFFRQFLVLAWWGLGLMSILAVGMLIWAGVLFITAAGNSGRIEEGKKIITGTITGIIVSLLAFVIVNTVIGGLTGTRLRVTDYFQGTIATIFSSDSGKKQGVERPFAGLGTVDTDESCHGSNNTEWDKTCSEDNLHIFCADPNGGDGTIAKYQLLLAAYDCNCLGSSSAHPLGNDGCFGGKTLACVRNFQIQNRLPPTGEFDEATRFLLNSTAGANSTVKKCTASFIDPIATKLPAIKNTRPDSGASANRGCCMVGDSSGLDYCVDNVTEITCSSMSTTSDNFAAGENCALSPKTKQFCGFCSDITTRSYQYVGEQWCKAVGFQTLGSGSTASKVPLSFTAGTCIGRGKLDCKNALLLTPEPVN